MTLTRIASICLFLLVSVLPASAELLRDPVVGGHLKTLNIYYQKPPVIALEDGFFSANSQRVALKGNTSESIEFEFALDNLLLYSDQPTQVFLPGDTVNRRLDLEHDWDRGQRWSDQLSVDRLRLRGNTENSEWSIGRQAIGFGRIVIFSPLDIVAPFAPDALDSDTRPGVDAIRGVHYFGLGGQVGGTVVFGDISDNNSYLLTLTDNRSKIDILGIGGVLRDRAMIGFGLAGSLGTLGVKIEASHYDGKNYNLPGGDLHDQFDIAALELWYRFENDIILLTQYLYNGAGAETPGNYISAGTSAAFQEGLSFLFGQQYLLIGPSWEFHPLATLSGLIIWNLEDDSSLFRPQLQFSLNDNLSLNLFHSFNFGKEPEIVGPGVIIPHSEFGSFGDSGGLLLRWYF